MLWGIILRQFYSNEGAHDFQKGTLDFFALTKSSPGWRNDSGMWFVGPCLAWFWCSTIKWNQFSCSDS